MKPMMLTAMTLAAAISIATISPAQAADPAEKIAYAANHVLLMSDIPASLGKPVTKGASSYSFSANVGRSFPIGLCGKAEGDQSWQVKGSRLTFSVNMDVRGEPFRFVTQEIDQYKGINAARKSFGLLATRAKNCKGSKSDTFTDDDGTVIISRQDLSTGELSTASVAGRPSVWINSDRVTTSTNVDFESENDIYTVYTLVNDSILQLTLSINSAANISAALRNDVDALAKVAAERWAGL